MPPGSVRLPCQKMYGPVDLVEYGRDALHDDPGQLLEIGFRNGERRHHDEHVREWAQDRAPAAGLQDDAMAGPLLVWKGRARLPVRDELDARQESPLADLPHVRMILHRPQSPPQRLDLRR